MGSYYVTGGRQISGELSVQGCKNACLPILAASVLCNGISIIGNCPDISDTHISIDILRALGCTAEFANGTVIVDASRAHKTRVPIELAKEMRSSILFAGSLLSRFRELTIYHPGGCAIDERPIDYHLNAFEELGATVKESNGEFTISAAKLKGKRIVLDFPSVGATENAMAAAVLAEGETQIVNPACEPEIVDLQNYLNKMGARIKGAGSGLIVIEGVRELKGGQYSVMADRIAAGTLLIASAITGGDITLTNMRPSQLYAVLDKLSVSGCKITEYGDSAIRLCAPKRIKAVKKIVTTPYPGFPTDMQAQMMALLAVADGKSRLSERIFDSRHLHIAELRKMGANIAVNKADFDIIGVPRLHGARVAAKDLRGGAALILAALAAEGETVIDGSCYVERGYECIEDTLASLGAEIKFEEREDIPA